MVEILAENLEGIAAGLRSGHISPVELTRFYLSRIRALDPRLSAYISVFEEEAMTRAETAARELSQGIDRGPLHGIPISIKDSIPTAGHPTSCGTVAPVYDTYRDAAVVGRLREGGAVFLGKNNLPELGLGSYHPKFPPVRNPWDLSRSAEGSSAGCAAAIAARLCVASLGSDSGGSIRRPAAHCGVVGLKPTYGLVDTTGVFSSSWSMEHLGPLALTVADTYMLMQAIVPRDRADALPVFEHPSMVCRHWRRDASYPRIGIVAESLAWNSDPEWADAFEEAISFFQQRGVKVTQVSLPSLPHSGFAVMAITLVETSTASVFADRTSSGLGEEASFWLDLGRLIPGVLYVDAHRLRRKLLCELAQAFKEVDVLVGPVTRGSPPSLERVRVPNARKGELDLVGQVHPTAPYNLAGLPAVSVPCGFSSSNLPLGLQLVARRHYDGLLLAMAWLYEQETKWWTRIPPLS